MAQNDIISRIHKASNLLTLSTLSEELVSYSLTLNKRNQAEQEIFRKAQPHGFFTVINAAGGIVVQTANASLSSESVFNATSKYLYAPNCTNITDLTIGVNLVVLDLTNCSNMTLLDFSGSLLKKISIKNCYSLQFASLGGNLLSTFEVDNIMLELVRLGVRDGGLDLSSNSAPSAAGTAYKNILISRGWAVATD